MIRSDNQINDGLDKSCKNNNKTVWTYNQGVILGGLAELSTLQHKKGPLQRASLVADAAIKDLADASGVLHDGCELTRGGGDVPQFKGIFVRNLALLNQRSPQRRYNRFILLNAAETSGLDAVVAALSLSTNR